MKFHPDKNKLPKAEDAFKKVAAAYSTLTDPKKKRIYDQDPSADIFDTQQRSSRSNFARGDFGGDIDPFDIFEMFFTGGFENSQRRAHFRARTRENHQQYQFHQ